MIQNRFRSWNFSPSRTVGDSIEKSSISDNSVYVDFCRLAVENDEVFRKFRSCKQYREILEHVTYDLGWKYLDEALRNGLSLKEVTMLTQENIGSPPRFTFKEIGKISPTQLRYAKVLSEIEVLFGHLTELNIAEIGVGYGGQAAQTLLRHKVNSYLLIDLPPVTELAVKFIQNRVNVDPAILTREIASSEIDLLISNYAFSELTRVIQEHYFKKYILESKRGYIIFNQFKIPNWDSWSWEEFLSRKKGSKILPEVPLTASGNVLIVWGCIE
jgi:hypothetical protein